MFLMSFLQLRQLQTLTQNTTPLGAFTVSRWDVGHYRGKKTSHKPQKWFFITCVLFLPNKWIICLFIGQNRAFYGFFISIR